MSDFNKKTLRHFYCRDALWKVFEKISGDADRGIDDLVNEAMWSYAREKGYVGEGESPARPTAVMRAVGGPPPPPPPPGRAAPSPYPPRPPGSVPPPQLSDHAAPAPPLYLVFQNQKYLIDKDQFIIGRGATSSDLPIKDGNVSRRHAAVIRRDGHYYIKDLGSTNGVDFNGQRIDNKRIEEGDTYHICEYQLRFTFR